MTNKGLTGFPGGQRADQSRKKGPLMRTITSRVVACVMLFIAALSAAGETQPPPAEPDYANENAGLARGAHPEILTWDRIDVLAVIRVPARRGAFAPCSTRLHSPRRPCDGVTDFPRFRTQFHFERTVSRPRAERIELSAGSWRFIM